MTCRNLRGNQRKKIYKNYTFDISGNELQIVVVPDKSVSYWPLSIGTESKFKDKLSSIDGDVGNAEWVNSDSYMNDNALEWNTDGGNPTSTNQYGNYIRGHTDPFSIGITVEKFSETELDAETIWSVGGSSSGSDTKLSCGFQDGNVGWGSRDDVINRSISEPAPPYKSRFLCTWDGSIGKFYIDGSEITNDITGRISNTSVNGELTFGSQPERERNLKTGRVINATFYKEAVTPSEDMINL